MKNRARTSFSKYDSEQLLLFDLVLICCVECCTEHPTGGSDIGVGVCRRLLNLAMPLWRCMPGRATRSLGVLRVPIIMSAHL